jgi:hypothetical protein
MSDPFMDSLSPDQKRALIAKLMAELPDEPDKEVSTIPTRPRSPLLLTPQVQPTVVTVNDDFTVNRHNGLGGATAKTPIKASKNTWVDDKMEHTDVETPVVEKTKKRPPAKMVDISCSGCGKICRVSSTIVYGEYHKCDKCAGARR